MVGLIGREPDAVGGSEDDEGREDLAAERARARARARSTRCEVPPMARPMPDPRVKARAATWVVRMVRA